MAVAGTLVPFLAERSDGSEPAAIDRSRGLWRRWAMRDAPRPIPTGALGPVQPAFITSGSSSRAVAVTVPVTTGADQPGTVAASGSTGSNTTSSPS